MNQYPLWKYLLVLSVLFLGTLYALPNLFLADPAIQINASRTVTVDEAASKKVLDALAAAGLEYKSKELTLGKELLVRFKDQNTQLKAIEVIGKALGNKYIVALNLAHTTPGWLQAIKARPMYLGLDLRGGVHFLLQVDMTAAVDKAYERYAGDLRLLFQKEKPKGFYERITKEKGNISLLFPSAEKRAQAYDLAREKQPDLVLTEREEEGKFYLDAKVEEEQIREIKRFALEQNMTTLRNRVNELGVAEPVVQQQGLDRIVVELPGIQDTARAKDILGRTATLEFRLQALDRDMQSALKGRAPVGTKLYYRRSEDPKQERGLPILLKRQVVVTGDQVTHAAAGLDSRSGTPMVSIRLDGGGGKKMKYTTRQNVGKPMAVVFIEKRGGRVVEEVINVATIQGEFSNNFQITGLDSTSESHDLALFLRAGALAAPLSIIEERTIGPSLGQESIDKGSLSVMIGFMLVLIFMAVYYKVFGLAANLALTFNLVILVALLSMLQATLTLPGIAGIVLTVGMAVDANVLIFERIREELRAGNTPQASISAGYSKAFSTIFDANITTLIVALLLLTFGTGPIKGFAVTLSLGILTSMFTAILGTRALINFLYGGRKLQKLPI